MRKISILIMISTVFAAGILSGCTNPLSDKDKFVGVWSGTYSYGGIGGLSVSITFLSDGTYTASLPLSTESGTWDVKDGKLVKTGGSNPMVAYTYSFTTDDKSLILSSTTQNEQWVLTKQ